MAQFTQIAFNAQESLLDKDNNIRHSHLVLPIFLFAEASKISLTQISAPACGISANYVLREKLQEKGISLAAEPLHIDDNLEDPHSFLLVDNKENITKLAKYLGVRLLSVVKESENSHHYLHDLIQTLGLDKYSEKFLANPKHYEEDSPKKKASALLYIIATTQGSKDDKRLPRVMEVLKNEDHDTTQLVRQYLVEIKHSLPTNVAKNPDAIQRHQQKASFIRHKTKGIILRPARNTLNSSQPLYQNGVRYFLNGYRLVDQHIERLKLGLKTWKAVKYFLKSHGQSIEFMLSTVKQQFLESDPSTITDSEILKQQYRLAHHFRDTLYSMKERMESDLIIPHGLPTDTYNDGYRILNCRSTKAYRILANHFLSLQQFINELTSRWINNPFLTPSVQQYRDKSSKSIASPQCKPDERRRRNALQKATFSILSKSTLPAMS